MAASFVLCLLNSFSDNIRIVGPLSAIRWFRVSVLYLPPLKWRAFAALTSCRTGCGTKWRQQLAFCLGMAGASGHRKRDLVIAQIRRQGRHRTAAHGDEFAVSTSRRAGIGKEHSEALAVRLVETLALGHHVRFGMAELWRRTCRTRGKGPSLKVFFHFPQQPWCHAALLDLFSGCLSLFSGCRDRIAGREYEDEHHPAPCDEPCRFHVHDSILSLTLIFLLFPRKSVGRRPLRAA